ncbi:MAG TPA: hypothetical protein VHA74_02310, partial [Candidatus Dojkabacteria bacterium]|nr:hypothetical protein [Candidatus Dojkabacteria bacterium]
AEKMLAQNIAYDAFNKQDAKKIIDLLDNSVQTNYTKDSLKKILSKGFSGSNLDNYTDQLYNLYVGNRVTGTADSEQGGKKFATNDKGKLGFDYGITTGGGPGRYLTEGSLNTFGFREITAENLRKKANLIDLTSATNSQQRTELLQQRKALLESAALMDTMNRVKFDWNLGFPDFSKTTSDLESAINNLNKKGTALTPQDLAFKSGLIQIRQTIEEAAKTYRKNTERRPNFLTVTSGLPQYDANSVKKAINAEYQYEKLRIDRLIVQLQNKGSLSDFDRQSLQSLIEKRGLVEAKEKALRTMPLTDFRFNFNAWLSAYSSVNENLIKGKLAGNIINGSFFRDEGFMNSSNFNNIVFKYKLNGKENTYSVRTMMFNENAGKAWQQLTYLYYLTPNVLVGSALTGEIPAFLAYNARHNLIDFLNNKKRFNALLMSPLGSKLKDFMEQDVNGNYIGFKKELSNDLKGYEKLLAILKTHNDPKIQKLISSTERVVNLGSRLAFFAPLRRFNQWYRVVDSKIGGRIRKVIAERVLKKLLDNAAWQTAVENFVSKNIGLLQMVRVYVQELVAATLEAVGV